MNHEAMASVGGGGHTIRPAKRRDKLKLQERFDDSEVLRKNLRAKIVEDPSK